MTMESWMIIPMINLTAVTAMMTAGWIYSLLRSNVAGVDSLWGLGFVLVAGVTFGMGDGFGGRSLLILVLTVGWGLRLAAYLTWRNWGQPEDHRYGQWREKSGQGFWLVSLFKVFWTQALFLWVISLVLQSAQLSAQPSRFTALGRHRDGGVGRLVLLSNRSGTGNWPGLSLILKTADGSWIKGCGPGAATPTISVSF